MNARLLLPALLLATLSLAACAPQRKPDAPSPSPASAPELRSQALIDSANAAFKAKDYEGAAKRYASAAAIQPDDPAAYYGLGMALSRLGRDDEAREAYAKSRALMGRSGDSLPVPH